MTGKTSDLIARSAISIAAPPDRVWEALVTPSAIKQYMFGTKTRVSLTQDNNPTEEARSHSEKNWGMMLQGLRKFLER